MLKYVMYRVSLYIGGKGFVYPAFPRVSTARVRFTEPLTLIYTGLGKRVVPRLRELAPPRGQREPGGGIHVT